MLPVFFLKVDSVNMKNKKTPHSEECGVNFGEVKAR